MPKVPIVEEVLILVGDPSVIALLRDQFEREPVEITIAKTAAEARKFSKDKHFDAIALDGIAPSEEGQEPSLVGPGLARELRDTGFTGFIIGISSDPQVQELIKRGADWIVLHMTHICAKPSLVGLIQELQGNYSAPSK